MTRGTLLIGTGLLCLLLAAPLGGCGREVKAPSLAGAQQAFAQAQGYEQAGQLQNAEQSYLAAFAGAEAAIKVLVPGDKLLPEAEELRSKSAEQVARIREELRKLEVTASKQVAGTGTRATLAKNLFPPVAPYAANAPEKTPGPVTPGTEPPKPPDGEKPPTQTPPPGTEPPKTDPPKTDPPVAEPPKEPVKAKEVRVTKVVLKDNKAVLIYWTFSNLTADKNLVFGAPAGKVLGKRGNSLTNAFQTFLLDGFQYNAADPGASAGKDCKADAFALKPGESKNLVTIGLVGANIVGQVGGASIELRMSEGEDFSDKCGELVVE